VRVAVLKKEAAGWPPLFCRGQGRFTRPDFAYDPWV